MKTLVQFLIESKKEGNGFAINGFAILKPEFLGLQDELEELLADNEWKINDMRRAKMSLDDARELYKCHEKEDWYDDLCKYMSSGDCICYNLYKDCDDPIEDLKKVKDIARKKWGKDDMRNCMHSSDSLDNVKRESKICFSINK